eukprot:1161819-Pelagomonas_calceolata.AAC.1
MVSTKAAPRAHRHRVQDPPHAAHMRCPRLFLQTAKFPFFRQRDFLPSGSGVSFPQAAEPLVLYSWNALAAPCSGIAWGCILFRPEELVPPFLTNKLAVWVGNALAARGLYHFCSWIALAALDLYHFCSWIAQEFSILESASGLQRREKANYVGSRTTPYILWDTLPARLTWRTHQSKRITDSFSRSLPPQFTKPCENGHASLKRKCLSLGLQHSIPARFTRKRPSVKKCDC